MLKSTLKSSIISARRLGETLKYEASKKTGVIPVVHHAPTAYEFDPKNPIDRDEAAAELLRLADWPTKGWLSVQEDIPEDLVDFIRDTHSKAPDPVPAWQSAILRQLSKSTQLRVINLAANRNSKE